MIVMEGLMSVPPERGTIIGRALWKVGSHDLLSSRRSSDNLLVQTRYVVLGSGAMLKTQNDILASAEAARTGRRGLKPTSSKPSLVDLSQMEPDKLYLSIYKQKVCGGSCVGRDRH
jgi:hypothetical protein